jgi:hypothetical protein
LVAEEGRERRPWHDAAVKQHTSEPGEIKLVAEEGREWRPWHDAAVKQHTSEPGEIKRGGRRDAHGPKQLSRSEQRAQHGSSCLDCSVPASENRRGRRCLHQTVAESTKTETTADGVARRDKAGSSGVGTTHAPLGRQRAQPDPSRGRQPAKSTHSTTVARHRRRARVVTANPDRGPTNSDEHEF